MKKEELKGFLEKRIEVLESLDDEDTKVRKFINQTIKELKYALEIVDYIDVEEQKGVSF